MFCSSSQVRTKEAVESGYGPLRQFIADNITGGKAPYQMANSTNTAQRIAISISHALQPRDEQFYWIGFRDDIRENAG